jgi:hypothetical protein
VSFSSLPSPDTKPKRLVHISVVDVSIWRTGWKVNAALSAAPCGSGDFGKKSEEKL